MPPRGVKKGTKRARQYEKIKKSQKQQGRSEGRAKEVAARTVQKERARSGESRQRSGTDRQKGRTRDQLYNEAKKRNIKGRSKMTKKELAKALGR